LTNNGDAFSFKGMSSQYEDQKTSFLNITQIKVSYQMIQKIISKNVKHFSKVESSIETVYFRDLMSKWLNKLLNYPIRNVCQLWDIKWRLNLIMEALFSNYW